MIRSFHATPMLLLLAVAGCSSTTALDWDLRSGAAFDTSQAAQQATSAPPTPDSRGVVSYPGYQVAVARRGDTVASLASRLGLASEDVARYNALQPADPLREGEILALPTRVAAASVAGPGTGAVIGGSGVDVTTIATTALDRVGSEAPSAGSQVSGGQVSGSEPARHRVARGETAFSISRTYGVSARALADWNGLGSDLAVREGQYLIIPTAAGPAPTTVATNSVPGQGSATPAPPSASQPLPEEKPAKASEPPKDTPASPDLGSQRTAASSTKMAMPVSGNIIRGYVKKKNDGIDISAPAGTPVKAAADGTIAAITTDTSGTPIVVIRHAGGLLTVYAGVEGVTLAKGAAVKRGQTIAKVRRGDPAFVHFEVRQGVESVDPLPYLQ
jgi:murein DD-endopeptidase MepM/ murein hydrolase activator NlpD